MISGYEAFIVQSKYHKNIYNLKLSYIFSSNSLKTFHTLSASNYCCNLSPIWYVLFKIIFHAK